MKLTGISFFNPLASASVKALFVWCSHPYVPFVHVLQNISQFQLMWLMVRVALYLLFDIGF
jgi:hypothetical protein